MTYNWKYLKQWHKMLKIDEKRRFAERGKRMIKVCCPEFNIIFYYGII